MKLISKLPAMLLLGSLLFTACHPKDRPANPALSVDKTSVTQAATAGTATIAVSSNITWKVTSSASWASVSSATGSNNGNVTITMTANDGTAVRTADITVSPSESGSSLTAQVVKVTQTGAAGSIANFSPAAGPIGSTLTINGLFGPSPIVKVNGVVATNVVLSSDSKTITCNVPTGATSGKVTVTFGNTTLTSTSDFVFYDITSFLPTFLPSNDQTTPIVISGRFDATATPVVKINGTVATVTDHTATSITVTLSTGTTDGKITVDFGGNTYTSTTDFSVTNRWKVISSGHSETHIGGAIFELNGKIYLGLGGNANSSATNNFTIFDLNTKTWGAGPSFPETAFNAYQVPNNYTVSQKLNNKVYIGTGFSPGGLGQQNLWWEYDPSQSGDIAWTRKTDFPVQVILASGFVINSHIYVGLGSYTANNPMIYQYDDINNSWINGFSTGITNSTVAYSSFVINNVAYFGGGSGNSSTTFYKYDPSTDATHVQTISTTLPALNYTDNYGNNTFVINNMGYVIDFSRNQIYKFDPTTSSWTTISSNLPLANSAYAITVNNKGYIVGSQGQVFEYLP